MSSIEADYVVVGGGLCGVVVASLLSRSSKNPEVILLEAGSDPQGEPNTDTILNGLRLLGGKFDYAYRSQPVSSTFNRVHTLNAGKALGGGTILNLAGWLRADAADYDEWSKIVGDSRWSYGVFKAYLERVEKTMQVSPVSSDPERRYPLRDPVAKAWTEIGALGPEDKDAGSIEGLQEMKENTLNGLRQPSYAAFPLDKVKVYSDTTVNKVLFAQKEEGKKPVAIGVQLASGQQIIARKEVILSAGAYRTPQLLLLSGIGDRNALAHHGIPLIQESPYVGKNLYDHFAIYMAFRLKDPSRGLALGSPGFSNPSFFKGLPYDWVESETVPETVLSKHVNGHRELQDKGKRNLFEVLTVYVPPGIPGIPIDGTHLATSTMLLLPSSRGTVSLNTANPADAPEIQPNYLNSDLDKDTLVHATRRTLQAILGTKALADYVEGETPPSGEGIPELAPLTLESSDDDILDRIRKTGKQHHHSGGTSAMGTVVDTDAKVLGVEKLRVIDASIVPVPLGGHPQATLYAMAELLAEVVIRDDNL